MERRVSRPAFFFLSVATILLNFTIGPVSKADSDENTRRISWRTYHPESSKALALAFGAPNWDDMESAECFVDVIRPRVGTPALATATNQAQCRIALNQGTEKVVSWSLKKSPIAAWGNRFHPKGFSIGGSDAEALYAALEKAYVKTQQKTPSSKAIRFDQEHFSSPALNFDWDEYAIMDFVPEYPNEDLYPLNCAKYYWYPTGSERPSTPSEIRCDFIYQYKYIEGDVF